MSEISYFLGDALGSVRQMTDETGTVTLARTYDPYGNVTSTGGTSSTSYGFTGETTDTSGLVYLRAQNDKKSFIKTEKPRPFCEIRVPLILILLLANAGRTFRFHLAMPANEVIISESCLYNIPQGENS